MGIHLSAIIYVCNACGGRKGLFINSDGDVKIVNGLDSLESSYLSKKKDSLESS